MQLHGRNLPTLRLSDNVVDLQNAKGKGKGKDHQDPANRPERSRSASPKHVTFQEDNSLLAQLKALVMKCDVHGEGSLLQDLKTLVLRFSQNNGPANKGEPKQPTDKKQRWNDNKEWATPKKDEAPWVEVVRKKRTQQRIQLQNRWWPEPATNNTTVLDALDEGKEPPGNLAITSTANAAKYRELAAVHKIKKKNMILFDEPDSEQFKQMGGVTRWCKLVGTWKQLPVVPLHKELPMWPQQPKVVDATAEPTVPDSLVILREKRFLTAALWEQAKKKPAEIVSQVFADGVSFRSYGWHHNPTEKEEAIIGFVKVPPEQVHTAMSMSGLHNVCFPKGFVGPDSKKD